MERRFRERSEHGGGGPVSTTEIDAQVQEEMQAFFAESTMRLQEVVPGLQGDDLTSIQETTGEIRQKIDHFFSQVSMGADPAAPEASAGQGFPSRTPQPASPTPAFPVQQAPRAHQPPAAPRHPGWDEAARETAAPIVPAGASSLRQRPSSLGGGKGGGKMDLRSALEKLRRHGIVGDGSENAPPAARVLPQRPQFDPEPLAAAPAPASPAPLEPSWGPRATVPAAPAPLPPWGAPPEEPPAPAAFAPPARTALPERLPRRAGADLPPVAGVREPALAPQSPAPPPDPAPPDPVWRNDFAALSARARPVSLPQNLSTPDEDPASEFDEIFNTVQGLVLDTLHGSAVDDIGPASQEIEDLNAITGSITGEIPMPRDADDPYADEYPVPFSASDDPAASQTLPPPSAAAQTLPPDSMELPPLAQAPHLASPLSSRQSPILPSVGSDDPFDVARPALSSLLGRPTDDDGLEEEQDAPPPAAPYDWGVKRKDAPPGAWLLERDEAPKIDPSRVAATAGAAASIPDPAVEQRPRPSAPPAAASGGGAAQNFLVRKLGDELDKVSGAIGALERRGSLTPEEAREVRGEQEPGDDSDELSVDTYVDDRPREEASQGFTPMRIVEELRKIRRLEMVLLRKGLVTEAELESDAS